MLDVFHVGSSIVLKGYHVFDNGEKFEDWRTVRGGKMRKLAKRDNDGGACDSGKQAYITVVTKK